MANAVTILEPSAVTTAASSDASHTPWDAAGVTDIGRAREANEDAYLLATLRRSIVVHDASPGTHGWFAGESAGTLMVVADGMGGQGGGDVASRVAVSTVSNYLLNVMPWVTAAARGPRDSITGVGEQLSSALVAGDNTVRSAGAQSSTPRMGTTLTMVLVLWPLAYVAHVGDTRCYLLRQGQLRALTTDHTLAQRVAEESHQPLDPDSHLHHILWNALGAIDEMPQPEIKKLSLEPNDVIMLCSDGLTKHVSDEQIASVLADSSSLATRCKKLVDLANAAGGSDNVTVVIGAPRPTSDRAARPSA